MKISNFLNLEAIEDDKSIVPMFGLSHERWDEIEEMAVSAFDACSSLSEAIKMVDKYFTFNNENEVIAMLFILSVEKGKLEGEKQGIVYGLDTIRNERILRMSKSASYLKFHNIPFPENFKKILKLILHEADDFIKQIMSKIINKIDDHNIEVKVVRYKDVFINKNKFKKSNFNIPDPNERPDKKSSDEESKEDQ